MSKTKQRCEWAKGSPLEQVYHDEEWGVPLHDEQRLFEFLVLEGAQAGLSWRTVLQKRPAYREAFAQFDIATVAAFDDEKIEQLLQNPGLIRNRLKIESARRNARACLEIQAQFGSLDKYFWSFVDGKAIQNHWQSPADIPAQTPLSEKLSRDLKKRGCNFVGPTICYAFMQAIGMVNDHTVDCFRYRFPEKDLEI